MGLEVIWENRQPLLTPRSGILAWEGWEEPSEFQAREMLSFLLGTRLKSQFQQSHFQQSLATLA